MNLEGQTSNKYELSDERNQVGRVCKMWRDDPPCFYPMMSVLLQQVIIRVKKKKKKREMQRFVLCLSVWIKAARRNKKKILQHKQPSTCFTGQRAVNTDDSSQPGAGSDLTASTGSVLASSSSHSSCKVSRETFWTFWAWSFFLFFFYWHEWSLKRLTVLKSWKRGHTVIYQHSSRRDSDGS